MKVAVTVRATFIVTLHTPVPEHGPDQPANFEPDDALAVSVTFVPETKAYEHVDPHLIPGVVEATVPDPFPVFFTVNVLVSAKVAVTDCAALIVTLQAAVPEHAPDQPVNFEPAEAVAVNVTDAPYVKACEHAVPQEMPLGLDETVPEPAPLRMTLRLFGGGCTPLLTTRFTGGPVLTVRCATAPATGLCETTAPAGTVAE